MTEESNLVPCYNRGCGTRFNLDNTNEDCQHHPGLPVFHDAYKIWSCCNKKSTDFSEFLSIKGCTKSKHSNVKPPEPPKPKVDKTKADEVIEVCRKSLNAAPNIERPPFDSPQIELKPTVSQTLLDQVKGLAVLNNVQEAENIIKIGQSCTNNSCKVTYQGPKSDLEDCSYHPGTPVFHEGLKYWSCCQKKTTEFSVFLEQPGCTQGKHIWIKKESNTKKVKCRLDWHQTATHVYVSVFAKKYDPHLSCIKLNPVHLTINLFFPEENSWYNYDSELRGIVNTIESSVNMLPTKVEIKLRKQEPGSWAKLDIPKESMVRENHSEEENSISCKIDAVDLSDL